MLIITLWACVSTKTLHIVLFINSCQFLICKTNVYDLIIEKGDWYVQPPTTPSSLLHGELPLSFLPSPKNRRAQKAEATTPKWKRKINLNQTSSFGLFCMFSTVFWGENSMEIPAQGSACCFLLGRCPSKRIADINTEFHTNFNHLVRFSLNVFGHPLLDHSPWFLEILLPPVLHHTPARASLDHCRMQSKSEDSNETPRNIFWKYIKKVHEWRNRSMNLSCTPDSYPTQKNRTKTTADPWICGSGV